MCAQTKREVLETQYTRMEDLPESSEAFADAAFTPDEWSENKVWVDRTEMLNEIIKCQGIKTNPLLSSWLQISIPPLPTVFTHNNHIFILRLKNGKCAAVQLENYMNEKGVKCQLTINYKYPY